MTPDQKLPLVSAVIPTRNRPDLVCRAVRSALHQTYAHLEVVVVVDGLDPATVAALEAMREARVRIVALPENVGGSEARNIGAREARGEWVALLDDDDEWLPEKLNLQMRLLLKSRYRFPIGTCRLFAHRDNGVSIIPMRMPKQDEPLSEYLICRKSPVWGEGVIQTSMLVVHKTLLEEVPFTSGLSRHQDWDWLLRVFEREDVGCEWVWQPLVIFHMNSAAVRVSKGGEWLSSLDWAAANPLLTKRAFTYFVAVIIAPKMRLRTDIGQLARLLAGLRKHGTVDLRAMMFTFAHVLVPKNLLRKTGNLAAIGRRRYSRAFLPAGTN
jgi:glycosyltransferase involved in cell wall biosynthesis